jgi:lincosamide nucleotidyltransferase A/C/D/E
VSTTAADVHEILDLLESLDADPRVSGGWGIDALVGRQTREHRDVDLGIPATNLDVALTALRHDGFAVTTDWLPVRIELTRGDCHVDLHPLTFRPDGSAWQAGLDDTTFEYPALDWVVGHVGDRAVICLSASRQRVFHAGYDLTDTDRHDLTVLEQHEQGPDDDDRRRPPARRVPAASDDDVDCAERGQRRDAGRST